MVSILFNLVEIPYYKPWFLKGCLVLGGWDYYVIFLASPIAISLTQVADFSDDQIDQVTAVCSRLSQNLRFFLWKIPKIGMMMMMMMMMMSGGTPMGNFHMVPHIVAMELSWSADFDWRDAWRLASFTSFGTWVSVVRHGRPIHIVEEDGTSAHLEEASPSMKLSNRINQLDHTAGLNWLFNPIEGIIEITWDWGLIPTNQYYKSHPPNEAGDPWDPCARSSRTSDVKWSLWPLWLRFLLCERRAPTPTVVWKMVDLMHRINVYVAVFSGKIGEMSGSMMSNHWILVDLGCTLSSDKVKSWAPSAEMNRGDIAR